MVRSVFFIVMLSASLAISSVKFDKGTVVIKSKKIDVEIAKTFDQQQQGLMFRKSLKTNAGMLFIFPDERILSFWMKNTIIDLSIAYINKEKKIVDIQEMKATSALELNPPNYPSRLPALYALEMNSGWFKKNKIIIGDKVIFNFEVRSQARP